MATTRSKIKELLLRRLQGVAIDSKLPSDRDFAKEFNVAFLTVNRAMRELQYEGYVVRRARQGTFLASRERAVANDLEQRGGAGTVVVVSPNYHSFHYWKHVRYVEEFALKSRLTLLEYKLNQDTTYDRVIAFARQAADLRGVAMVPVPNSLTDEVLARFDALGCPVVFLSTQVALGRRSNLHCLHVDLHEVGRLAAETLLAQGHRKLAWVQNEPEPSPLMLKGIVAALRARELEATDLTCLGRGVRAWEDSREAAYRLTCQLLDTCDATAAIYDGFSAHGPTGALRALGERGLRVPEDFSIIAPGSQCGDEDYLLPPTTSLEWDWREEVRQAFEIIARRQKPASREILFPVTVVARQSVAPPRPAPAAAPA